MKSREQEAEEGSGRKLVIVGFRVYWRGFEGDLERFGFRRRRRGVEKRGIPTNGNENPRKGFENDGVHERSVFDTAFNRIGIWRECES